MNTKNFIAGLSLLAAGVAAGWGLSSWRTSTVSHDNVSHEAAAPAAKAERKVLYWYDPMSPTQHFDKPGKSPFMDMQLVPKFAPGAATDCTIRDVKADGGEVQP